MNEFLPLISTATALIAVIVGPIITSRIARKQIRATTISTNRQVWINSLRDAIAEWLTARRVVLATFETEVFRSDDGLRSLERMLLLEFRVRLLVNPAEEDHSMLLRLLREETVKLGKRLDQPAKNEDETDTLSDEKIVAVAQIILKKEWERVKEGD